MTTFSDVRDALEKLPADDRIRQWYELFLPVWLSHLEPLNYDEVGSAPVRKLCAKMNRKEHEFLEHEFKRFVEICPNGKLCQYNGGKSFSEPCLTCSMIWYDSLYPNDPAALEDKIYRMAEMHGPGVIGAREKWHPTSNRKTA